MGRNMDRIFIVENTPDCVLLNPANGILVEDFSMQNNTDNTLLALAWIIQHMCASGKTVPNYLCSCPLLHRREVILRRTGEPFMALCLDSVAALDKWSPAEVMTSRSESEDLSLSINDKQTSGERWAECRKDLEGKGLSAEEMNENPIPKEHAEVGEVAGKS